MIRAVNSKAGTTNIVCLADTLSVRRKRSMLTAAIKTNVTMTPLEVDFFMIKKPYKKPGPFKNSSSLQLLFPSDTAN